MKTYITRTEYLSTKGLNVRNGGQGKCDDAWSLFAMAYRHGITDKATIVAAGKVLGMNEGNLRAEYGTWFDANFPTAEAA